MGFSKGWQGCSEGNPQEQPCQPAENPILPTFLLRLPFYIFFFSGKYAYFCDFYWPVLRTEWVNLSLGLAQTNLLL